MSNVTLSLLISFLAGISTFIGGLVVFIKFKDKNKFLAFSLSFSLSVMLSISVFELIPESIMTLLNKMSFLLAFLSGLLMFVLGKILVSKINYKTHLLSGNSLYRVGVLSMIALMIHNFPEGLAIGSGFEASTKLGIGLAIAICLHDIPEGISMAVPMKNGGMEIWKVIFYVVLSGVTTGIGAFFGAIIGSISETIIAINLSFAAGAMLYIVSGELIPESNKLYKGRMSAVRKYDWFYYWNFSN